MQTRVCVCVCRHVCVCGGRVVYVFEEEVVVPVRGQETISAQCLKWRVGRKRERQRGLSEERGR